jgi:NADPH:quinone reductase-like Zn-dependent oxidoreductase
VGARLRIADCRAPRDHANLAGDDQEEVEVKTRALVVKSHEGGAASLALEEIEMPALAEGDVLIRVAAAPINPSDLLSLKGTYEVEKPEGTAAGLEGSGVVLRGRGMIARFLRGRRVAFAAKAGSGSWAGHAVARANQCAPLEKSVSDEAGATLLTNPLTAYVMVRRAMEEGHAAFVNAAAAGALGRMISRYARDLRFPVIDVVRGAAQVERMVESGSTDVLDMTDEEFEEKLTKRCREKNATLALDPVSGKLTATLARAIAKGGVVRVYGSLSAEPSEVAAETLLFDRKSVEGFIMYEWLEQTELLQQLLALRAVQKRLSTTFATEIVGRFPFADFGEALEKSQAAKGGKVLFLAGDSKE